MNKIRNYTEISKKLTEDVGIPYLSEDDFYEFEKSDDYYPDMTDSEYYRGITNFIQPQIYPNKYEEWDYK